MAAVLVDAQGRVVERCGPEVVTTWRSSAKPFQLEGSLGLLGAASTRSLADEDLALGASSHNAEPAHLARLEPLLARLGLAEPDLMCGEVWPMRERETHALLRSGGRPRPLQSDCSGKHLFMAAAARARGWPRDYRPPDHPLQAHLLALAQERAAGDVRGVAADDCGVPTFVLSLAGMARAWAVLARATDRGEGDLGRVGRAMRRCWWWASGTDRVDGTVMQRTPAIAKIGAMALICFAFPAEGLGLAVKVLSGDGAIRAPATRGILDRWLPGFLPEDALAGDLLVRDDVGRPVGDLRPTWR